MSCWDWDKWDEAVETGYEWVSHRMYVPVPYGRRVL